MKKELTLGIDIDGTITDPYTFIPHLNDFFGKNFSYEEVITYDLLKLYGITPEEYEKWHTLFGSNIYQTAPLAKHAKEIIYYFKNKFELIFISARSENYRKPTMKWFEINNIPFDQVILTGSAHKCQEIIQNNIEIFMEDNYDAAVYMSDTINIPILLIDTPYNQGKLPKTIHRIYSWIEAKEWIDNYSKKQDYTKA